MQQPQRVCTLLSISSTTAWTDWVHGDLWLCPDGVLRRSRGWRATLANAEKGNVKESVDNSNRPRQTFTDDECRRIAGEDKRNWWVTWGQVSSAKLTSGPMSYGLHLVLTDGRKVSLRWLRQDGPIQPVKAALQEALGDRLAA